MYIQLCNTLISKHMEHYMAISQHTVQTFLCIAQSNFHRQLEIANAVRFTKFQAIKRKIHYQQKLSLQWSLKWCEPVRRILLLRNGLQRPQSSKPGDSINWYMWSRRGDSKFDRAIAPNWLSIFVYNPFQKQ